MEVDKVMPPAKAGLFHGLFDPAVMIVGLDKHGNLAADLLPPDEVSPCFCLVPMVLMMRAHNTVHCCRRSPRRVGLAANQQHLGQAQEQQRSWTSRGT